MSDKWIPAPASLVIEAAKVLSLGLSEGEYDELVEVPPALLTALADFIGEGADCDHSVGICGCEWAGLAHELRLAADGKKLCRACGGDGVGWDQAKADEWRAENPGWDDWSAGFIDCVMCGGPGVLEVTSTS